MLLAMPLQQPRAQFGFQELILAASFLPWLLLDNVPQAPNIQVRNHHTVPLSMFFLCSFFCGFDPRAQSMPCDGVKTQESRPMPLLPIIYGPCYLYFLLFSLFLKNEIYTFYRVDCTFIELFFSKNLNSGTSAEFSSGTSMLCF